mgnify:FL=1
MKPQTFNRTEKKDEKLTKQEKAYNYFQKTKLRAESRKKVATTA